MEAFAEAVVAMFEWGATGGPRWMRIGLTAVLLAICAALLTISLWMPR